MQAASTKNNVYKSLFPVTRARGERAISKNNHYLLAAILIITALAVVSADPPEAPTKPTPPEENGTNCSDAIEICDGLDNDCDGLIDENLTRNATCGLGVCQVMNGTEVCFNGTWINSTCIPLNSSTDEICDGLDNDCDGQVDEISACTPPPSNNNDNKGGGGGGNPYYQPSDDEEEEEEIVMPVTKRAVDLHWHYEEDGNKAETNITDENSSILRIGGPMSRQAYEERAPKRIIIDTEPEEDKGEEEFTPLQSITFTDEQNNTHNDTYEEIIIEFTLARGRLYDLNLTPEDITVLYRSQGSWRRGNVTYNASTGTYLAELINVNLNQLLIGTDQEVTLVPTREPETEPATTPPSAEPEEHSKRTIWPFIVIAIIVLGGGATAYYFIKEKQEKPTTTKPPVQHDEPQQRQATTTQKAAEQGAQTIAQPQTSTQQPASQTTARPITRQETLNEQVNNYIKRQRAKGVPEETIKQKLLANGWKEELVQEHMQYQEDNMGGERRTK